MMVTYHLGGRLGMDCGRRWLGGFLAQSNGSETSGFLFGPSVRPRPSHRSVLRPPALKSLKTTVDGWPVPCLHIPHQRSNPAMLSCCFTSSEVQDKYSMHAPVLRVVLS